MQLIEKIASLLMLPPGFFIFTMLLLSAWTICKQKHKFIGMVILFIAVIMYITSIPIFAFYLNDILDHTYQRSVPPDNVKSAAVVLAGGVSEDENGQPFQPSISTVERLYAAVKLSKEYPSCKFLIMSGCDAYDESVTPVAVVMRDAARTMDCRADIIIEDKSRNTDENLRYSAEIVKKLGVKHVVIVTSNSHIKRAMDFAYRYMPDDVKLYAYPSGGYKAKIKLSAEIFLPNVSAWSASCIGIKELIGGVVASLSHFYTLRVQD